jgi:hypothetical protein
VFLENGKKGAPDFFVFRLFHELEFEKQPNQAILLPKTRISEYIQEWYFVEVKSESDALRSHQLLWFAWHPEVPKIIALVIKSNRG